MDAARCNQMRASLLEMQELKRASQNLSTKKEAALAATFQFAFVILLSVVGSIVLISPLLFMIAYRSIIISDIRKAQSH